MTTSYRYYRCSLEDSSSWERLVGTVKGAVCELAPDRDRGSLGGQFIVHNLFGIAMRGSTWQASKTKEWRSRREQARQKKWNGENSKKCHQPGKKSNPKKLCIRDRPGGEDNANYHNNAPNIPGKTFIDVREWTYIYQTSCKHANCWFIRSYTFSVADVKKYLLTTNICIIRIICIIWIVDPIDWI